MGERFLKRTQPGLEAQLANLADAIAYNNHDVDDGVRAGLIKVEELRDVRVFCALSRGVVERYPDSPAATALRNHSPDGRLSRQRRDRSVAEEHRRIEASTAFEAVRARSQPLISLSDGVLAEHQELKRFLRAKLYNHPKVREVMDEAGGTLKDLFDAYMDDPSRLATRTSVIG